MGRIAIVCGAGIVSGKEIMALELATGLREQGHGIEIITSVWGNGDFRRRMDEAKFRTHVMRLGFISATLTPGNLYMTAHQILYWPALLAQFRHFLRSAAPQKVVHTNWHHLLLLLPLLRPERDLFWVHEVLPATQQYRKVFALLARRLGGFIAVSHAVARSLVRLGIPEEKILVIHNGLADPVASSAEKKRNGGRLVVGIVGQIGEWKGHEDLLEAFADVAPRFNSAELHICGRGTKDYEEQLKKKAAALKIDMKVTWRGYIGDRAKIYEDMNICVVPSHSDDPLPTVAIEAAFFALPVIATNRGGLPEIISDGVTGFMVDSSNPAMLASRLAVLLGDDALRLEMGRKARSNAVEEFSRKRFVTEFERRLAA